MPINKFVIALVAASQLISMSARADDPLPQPPDHGSLLDTLMQNQDEEQRLTEEKKRLDLELSVLKARKEVEATRDAVSSDAVSRLAIQEIWGSTALLQANSGQRQWISIGTLIEHLGTVVAINDTGVTVKSADGRAFHIGMVGSVVDTRR